MDENILIVDDSHVVRALYSYTLRDKGFRTLEADSGISALEVLQNNSISLAIVDINMRHMDGITLVTQIRANPQTKDLPVIIISSNYDANHIARGKSAGANMFLVKPPDPEELISSVRGLINIS
jgi:two-component system, chemotaxis family, chemotaxis protein CheY